MTRWSLFLLVACAPLTPHVTSWHADVRPLVESRCGGCHREGGIGPFPLASRGDLVALGGTIKDVIAARTMPPWPASRSCADYAPDGSLSDAQIALITQWLDDGALEGSPAEYLPLDDGVPALSRVDLRVPMKKPYTPSVVPDEYRCFVLDWPQTQDTHIAGFALEPGDAQMIHHADIFFINPLHAAEYQANDPNGDGYTCYNLPVLEGGWIGTFVPGSRGADFPELSGLKIEPGSKIFMQIHYNTALTGRRPDLSSLALKLESRVRKPGSVQALADLEWINNRTMVIPAFDADAVHRYEIDPTPFLSVANRAFVDGQPVKIWAGTLHMHQMGSRATLEILRNDGTRDCITDLPKWDFHWQLPYSLRAPKTVFPGDKIAVECHWDNSAEHQPLVNGTPRVSRELNWGANTNDEMCVAGVYLTQ